MSLHWYARLLDGSITEITSRVQLLRIQAAANASEGGIGEWQLIVDDTAGTFDIRGLRLVYAQEDEALTDDYAGVVFVGYTGDRNIGRQEENANEWAPDARTWSLDLYDVNSLLWRRLMVGSDNKRPEGEDDIDRVRWLLATAESRSVGIDNDDTWIASTSGVDMDKVDYTTQSMQDIWDDCAQKHGRNYFLFWLASGETVPFTIKAFFHRPDAAVYSSSIRISNDRADQDGVTYFPARGTKLNRSPDRIASTVIEEYDGGYAVYTNGVTQRRFGPKDVTASSPNVKTRARAMKQAARKQADISTELDTITTAIIVEAAQVNAVVQGHRVQIRLTDEPGYGGDFVWMRVRDRTVRLLAARLGAQAPLYELALTLTGDSQETLAGAAVTNQIATIQGSYGPNDDPLDIVKFAYTGDDAAGGYPHIPTVGPYSYIGAPGAYTGVQVDGDGVVDVTFHCTWVCVITALGITTFTLDLRLNDVTIATVTADSPYNGGYELYANWDSYVIIPGVEVHSGDLFSGYLHPLPRLRVYKIPWGVAQLQSTKIQLTNGNVV